MKRYIHASQDEYLAKIEEVLSNPRRQHPLSQRSKDWIIYYYTMYLNDQSDITDQLEDEMNNELFRNARAKQLAEKFAREQQEFIRSGFGYLGLDQVMEYFLDGQGSNCWFYPTKGKDYMKLIVGDCGAPYGNNPFGLQWLADMETGGDGSIVDYAVGSLPPRIKRRFKEYREMLVPIIEDMGFEIVGPSKSDQSGFYYPVVNDTLLSYLETY